ncbi:MAG TPA: WXG100 family type VII secretion target [Streptosporangiaceae bacterium]|jgi:WXG100 family type VII secretion target
MSEYTRAVFGSLQSGEADFASIYAKLQGTISTLDAQLRSNLAQWDGEAQQAYYVAKAKWDAAMANMQVVLNNLRSVIGEANVNYSTTEAANANLWNG